MDSNFLNVSELVGKSGKVSTSTALSSAPVLALYFSAHWCPPCRMFTPELAKLYKAWNTTSKQIEIIFISSDRDEKSWEEYYGEMPWLALPFDPANKSALAKKYGVQGIPMLIIVDNNGKVKSLEARDIVDDEGENAIKSFLKL